MKDLKSIIAPFQEDHEALLQELCKYVNDPILVKISEADYGHQSTAYLNELRKIKQHQKIHQMNFDVALSEVLHLTRWEKPEDTRDNRITKIQRHNLAIAFSCAIMLSVPHQWYQNRMGEHSAVIRLIQTSEYLEYLFPKMLDKASRLLAWRITENGTDLEEIPFFILGLVLTLLKSGDYQETQLIELIEQLLLVEQKAYDQAILNYSTSPEYSNWLFRNTFFNGLLEDWRSYQPFLSEQSDQVKSEELKAHLRHLATLLA